jgi:hypothetical protein
MCFNIVFGKVLVLRGELSVVAQYHSWQPNGTWWRRRVGCEATVQEMESHEAKTEMSWL